MAVGSLYPSFVQINYHSPYAPHVMTIPTNQWETGPDGGTFQAWDASLINAPDMVHAMVLKIVPFYAPAVIFDSFTIFTKAAVDAPAIPRYSEVLNEPGTNPTPGNYKAVQSTWTAKCDNGSLAKFSFMDVGNNNSFERVTFATVGADGTAFLNEWFAATNAWRSRLDGRPYFFLQASYTLNEELRRQYHEN